MANGDLFNKMTLALDTDIKKIERIRAQLLMKDSDQDVGSVLYDLQQSLKSSLDTFQVKEYEIERTLEKWLLLKQDLNLAREVQKTIFPQDNIYLSNFQLAGFTRAASSLGGDYYTYNISNTGVNAAIGDISGKGIANALITIMFDSHYKNLVYQEMSLQDILFSLNQFFRGIVSNYNGLGEKFMTFLAFRFMEKIEYAGAGHEYILVNRADQKMCERIKTGGIALGLMPELMGQFSHGEIELNPGDCLVTYSDGITEARNEQGSLFGLDRLVKQVELHSHLDPERVIQKIVENVDEFQGTHEQYDDITLLIIKHPE
ncbi:MAG: hypothetical protein B6244_03430 [Candidatus Cloacimonetes bacterium 4572_55]|nr:MAG: hypothetical protein B6244_03430 [Candidatus Cloacimonetes bacterium 4572_55]